MNNLRSVIRLHRWQLDEKQRALAELRTLEDRLHAERTRLDEDIRHEQALARQAPEVAHAYAGYAGAAIERRARLGRSIAQVEIQIAAAVEDMAAAFQDVKRYELAQEERDRREQEKMRRRADALLDETALVGFQRRKSEPEG